MRYAIQARDIPLTARAEQLIDRKIAKLDRRLKTYRAQSARLDLHLTHGDADRAWIECTLRLRAFRDRLHAQKGATGLREALNLAFDALFKEIEHHRARKNRALRTKPQKAGGS